MSSFEDVNGDGLKDIVVHVDATALEQTVGDMEAVLEGKTFDGIFIRGTDTVRIIEQLIKTDKVRALRRVVAKSPKALASLD